MHKKDIMSGYACLECRKVFKKHKYVQDKRGKWEALEYDVVCPQCSGKMYETGTAFKAPKMDDVKAWKKLQPLFEGGYKFYPDFGNPFLEPEVVKQKKKEMPESIFRKQARKRK